MRPSNSSNDNATRGAPAGTVCRWAPGYTRAYRLHDGPSVDAFHLLGYVAFPLPAKAGEELRRMLASGLATGGSVKFSVIFSSNVLQVPNIEVQQPFPTQDTDASNTAMADILEHVWVRLCGG